MLSRTKITPNPADDGPGPNRRLFARQLCLPISPTSLRTPIPSCSLPHPLARPLTRLRVRRLNCSNLKLKATRKSELRHKNTRLRQKINSILEQHPELRDVTDEMALKQGTRVRVGTPFLERIQSNLQGERER